MALKGLDEGCLMPDGSQEEYCVTLTRDKTITQLPEIRFEKPGDYHYVLTMTREDQKQIAVYYLHVMAVNGENGELTVTSTLREKDPQGTKTDELRFADDEGKKPEKEPEKKRKIKQGRNPAGRSLLKQVPGYRQAMKMRRYSGSFCFLRVLPDWELLLPNYYLTER